MKEFVTGAEADEMLSQVSRTKFEFSGYGSLPNLAQLLALHRRVRVELRTRREAAERILDALEAAKRPQLPEAEPTSAQLATLVDLVGWHALTEEQRKRAFDELTWRELGADGHRAFYKTLGSETRRRITRRGGGERAATRTRIVFEMKLKT